MYYNLPFLLQFECIQPHVIWSSLHSASVYSVLRVCAYVFVCLWCCHVLVTLACRCRSSHSHRKLDEERERGRRVSRRWRCGEAGKWSVCVLNGEGQVKRQRDIGCVFGREVEAGWKASLADSPHQPTIRDSSIKTHKGCVCVWSPLKRSHFVLSPASTTQTSLFEATTHSQMSLQHLNEQRRLENLKAKAKKS